MRARVLIDSTNLRHGGALQVVVSFLGELVRVRRSVAPDTAGCISDQLTGGASKIELANTVEDPAALAASVLERRCFSLPRWDSLGSPYDVAFSIRGPRYGRRDSRHAIVGFAGSTSLYGSMLGLPRRKGCPETAVPHV